MAMVCPQCSGSYEQRLQCPTCGVRLLYDFRGPRPKTQAPGPHWQQTPWGRILIGLVLAQGLYFALQHLLLGLLEVLNNQGLVNWTWTSVSGLVFLQILQVLTLTAGGMLAGGGQQRGVMLGGLVGVWNGVLSVLLDPFLHPDFVPMLTTLTLVGVPLVHIAVRYVRRLDRLHYLAPGADRRAGPAGAAVRKPGVAARRAPLFAGRVAWFRVLLGAVVAAAGYMTAAAVFNFLIDFSAGRLTSDGWWQDRVVTWEIQALAVLIGGGRGGLQHGQRPQTGPVRRLAGLGIPDGRAVRTSAALRRKSPSLTEFGCFCLCLAGGWFGSQLFPPVVAYKSRRLNTAQLS